VSVDLPTPTPWVSPDGVVMDRLELHLTYTCPERCVFCSEDQRMADFHPYAVTWGRVASVLRTTAERGVKSVHLTGGEPTIHPEFVETLMLAKKLGMRTSVGTIGTMLQKPTFARKALPYLDEALFSLHGPDAATHDALTRRPGSFDRVTRAIRTCLAEKPGFNAYVNTVLTRQNVDALGDTLEFADSLGAKLIVISNTTPEGAGYTAYEELAVPLDVLARVLPTVPSRVKHAVVRFFGTPMCLLGEHWTLSNDLHWNARVTYEWTKQPGKVVFDGLYNWAPDRKRVHVAACEACDRKAVCMGVFDRYAELWPTDALRPHRETR
jgi:MoaA/NifB/PqqE/SkfB family radical SAM enzyme